MCRRIDLQTHAYSAFDNLWPWLFDLRLRINTCDGLDYISIAFGVNCSIRFPFRARTDTQTDKVTDMTDHYTTPRLTATASVGNKQTVIQRMRTKRDKTDAHACNEPQRPVAS